MLVHAIAQQRIKRHGHEARGVAPVFEELARPVGELIERRYGIRPEPRERRDVVRARQHIDGIDLEFMHPRGELAQLRDARPRRPRAEHLRGDGEAARLGERERAAIQSRAAHRRRTSCSRARRPNAAAGPGESRRCA